MLGDKKRGFAAMDADKKREVARKGGRAAQAKGTAHRFSSEEARHAARRKAEVMNARRQAAQPPPPPSPDFAMPGGNGAPHSEQAPVLPPVL
jgi:general stress protein YciG